MRSRISVLAAPLLGTWIWACAPPVATCTDDDDCPGDLVCDAPTGVCALGERGGQDERERRALAEGPAPGEGPPDEEPPTEEPPAEEPPAEEPPAEEPPDDDDEDDDDSGDWGCWPEDDADDDDAEAGEDAGQCLELEEPCSFDDDACCEHTHCCPVFLVCVPNFWE